MSRALGGEGPAQFHKGPYDASASDASVFTLFEEVDCVWIALTLKVEL